MFKIPLSLQCTGWLMAISPLDYFAPKEIFGSIIPQPIINQQGGLEHCEHICLLDVSRMLVSFWCSTTVLDGWETPSSSKRLPIE